MRILFISRTYPGQTDADQALHDRYLDAVRDAGAELDVDADAITSDGFARLILELVTSLEAQWRTSRPDVVHAYGCLPAVAALAASDGEVALAFTPNTRPGQSPVDVSLARRADVVVVHSSAERELWHQAGVPVARIHVVPLPADRHPPSRSPRGPVTVLTDAVGPDLDLVIRSMASWPASARLRVLPVPAEEAERAGELAEAFDLAHRVEVLTESARVRLAEPEHEAWRGVAVVLVAGGSAGCGALAVEGAARGVPAISLAAGASGDVVVPGATGVQLDPDADAAAVGRAVRELLADDVRLRGYGLAARMRVRAMHDAGYVGEQAMRAYDAARRRAAGRAVAETRPGVPEPGQLPAEAGSAGVAAEADCETGPGRAPSATDPRQLSQDALVVEYLPVARRLARRYAGRGQSLADLTQVANLGLVKAARRFDPEQGTDFLSYAVPTMLGEIRRYFRDNAWAVHVPRGLQEMALRVQRADDELRQDLGHEASAGDVAGDLGLTEDEVRQGRLVSGVAFATRSLDAPLLEDSGTGLADILGEDDVTLEHIEEREALREAFGRLPAREREILARRFFGEQTQSEIAEQLGISQMHVSRLLARTLQTLREHVVADAALPAGWEAPTAS